MLPETFEIKTYSGLDPFFKCTSSKQVEETILFLADKWKNNNESYVIQVFKNGEQIYQGMLGYGFSQIIPNFLIEK